VAVMLLGAHYAVHDFFVYHTVTINRKRKYREILKFWNYSVKSFPL